MSKSNDEIVEEFEYHRKEIMPSGEEWILVSKDTLHTVLTTKDQEKAAMVQKWQPIETAPKDGTHVLVCNIYTFQSQGVATVAHWFNYIGDESKSGWFLTWNKNEADADCGMESITHWMPLPEYKNGVTLDTNN